MKVACGRMIVAETVEMRVPTIMLIF